MDIIHTCCVTGHREIPEEKVSFVREQLYRELTLAIQEGYTHFISGFAAGVDLIYAEIVSELKGIYPITLEAAVPYAGRMKTSDKKFQEMIQKCDVVKVHAKEYSKDCYMVRNRYMVDVSSRVIVVHDGRQTGGTAATARYARKAGRVIREIRI